MEAAMIEKTITPAADADVDRLSLHLCQLAIDADRTTDQLEAVYLTDGHAALLTLPITHLRLVTMRLIELVREVDRLDQRPRRERLEAA
jgi:hypothetical protein